VPALDGLRAVAVLGVMGFHFAPAYVTGGTLGVDIFFVLSGWLITSILLSRLDDAGRIDYGDFLLKRARRLLPAFGLLLVVYAALAPVLFPSVAHRRWEDVLVSAAYLTNLRQTVWPADTPLSHTWSLAVEGQFYLLWPLALAAALKRRNRGQAALLFIGCWVALTLARTAWEHLFSSVAPAASYYFTPFRSTGLLLGAALALHPLPIRSGRPALLLLLALLVGARTHVMTPLAQPAAEIATALVVANPPRLLAHDAARALGKISYGVYLWHIPIAWTGWFHGPFGLAGLVVASILAGWLSFIFERPWRRPGGTHPERTAAPVSLT
jgi:peptidoglycan/LPS O-acetylase OafA/YrhL